MKVLLLIVGLVILFTLNLANNAVKSKKGMTNYFQSMGL